MSMDTPKRSKNINPEWTTKIWIISNFSRLADVNKLKSPIFSIDGVFWQLELYPKFKTNSSQTDSYISIYVFCLGPVYPKAGWQLKILNTQNPFRTIKGSRSEFKFAPVYSSRGYQKFCLLKKILQSSGFINCSKLSVSISLCVQHERSETPEGLGHVLFKQLADRSNNTMADLNLVGENFVLKAHTSVMAEMSPVFRSLIKFSKNSGDFNSVPGTTIRLTHVPQVVLEAILEFCYTGKCADLCDHDEELQDDNTLKKSMRDEIANTVIKNDDCESRKRYLNELITLGLNKRIRRINQTSSKNSLKNKGEIKMIVKTENSENFNNHPNNKNFNNNNLSNFTNFDDIDEMDEIDGIDKKDKVKNNENKIINNSGTQYNNLYLGEMADIIFSNKSSAKSNESEILNQNVYLEEKHNRTVNFLLRILISADEFLIDKLVAYCEERLSHLLSERNLIKITRALLVIDSEWMLNLCKIHESKVREVKTKTSLKNVVGMMLAAKFNSLSKKSEFLELIKRYPVFLTQLIRFVVGQNRRKKFFGDVINSF